MCVTDDDAPRACLEAVAFTGRVCPPADQSIIDMAVLHTPPARTFAVGPYEEIETESALMVAETNTFYRNSGVNQGTKLVAVEEVQGHESPTRQGRYLISPNSPVKARKRLQSAHRLAGALKGIVRDGASETRGSAH